MKVFSTLFLLVLVSVFLEHSSGALPNIGSCTYREYINKLRFCITTFIVNMRRDPQGQCSPKLEALKDCIVEKVQQCNLGLSKSEIRGSVHRLVNEERYCDNAGISDPYLHPQKHLVPCSPTYFQKAYGCYNETLVLWRTSKTDNRLCSVYSDAIKCEKSLIDAECWYTGVTKELIELNYDGWNPFCAPLQSASRNVIHDGLTLILSLLASIAVARYSV